MDIEPILAPDSRLGISETLLDQTNQSKIDTYNLSKINTPLKSILKSPVSHKKKKTLTFKNLTPINQSIKEQPTTNTSTPKPRSINVRKNLSFDKINTNNNISLINTESPVKEIIDLSNVSLKTTEIISCGFKN